MLSFTLRKLGFAPRELATPAALDAGSCGAQPGAGLSRPRASGKSGALDVLPILARHGYEGPVQLMSGRSQSVLDEVVAAGERQGLKMLPAFDEAVPDGCGKGSRWRAWPGDAIGLRPELSGRSSGVRTFIEAGGPAYASAERAAATIHLICLVFLIGRGSHNPV